ncbi:MAG: MarR family transcriptional regulator [Lachnospiraceae bacterium]|nr:MarR family transcriptional regulator [Lachnospiraceae bacterium]
MEKSIRTGGCFFRDGVKLSVYEKIKARLSADNICVSDTTVRPRNDIYLFDYDAVNEAVLNALVHNDWTVTEPQISLFSDRMEILSHGGLPSGMSTEDFYEGISHPRNSTLMRVFLNIGLTEHTGHGVPTIIKKYGKEVFEITDNYIKCRIPYDKNVLEMSRNNVGINVGINKTEKAVLGLLINNPEMTAEEIAIEVGVTKRTVERTLVSLKKKGLIERIGSNKNGSWAVVK